jgi:hypothetical protein
MFTALLEICSQDRNVSTIAASLASRKSISPRTTRTASE